MTARSVLNWMDGMKFKGTTPSGHDVIFDTVEKVGGSNSAGTPMEVLALSFGACTAMDVVSILKKKKQKLDAFRVEMDTDKAEDFPKVYTKVHIKYMFSGDELEEAACKRSIELSMNKYCPVSAMLKKADVEISWEMTIN